MGWIMLGIVGGLTLFGSIVLICIATAAMF